MAMRIKIISDLHLEFRTKGDIDILLSSVLGGDYDVIVFAGDIANGWLLVSVMMEISEVCARSGKQAIFVPGNHEFYDPSPRIPAHFDAVHTLVRECWTFQGVTFAGLTALHSDEVNANATEELCLPYEYRAKEHTKDLEFLEKVKHKADVIITHYLPHARSIDAKYWTADNRDFHVPLDNFVRDTTAKLWIHGHTHSPCDYDENGTRVVCNPFGYPGEKVTPLSPFDRFGKIVTI